MPLKARFGTLLGITHGGVEVYSCDYQIGTCCCCLWDIAFKSKLKGTFLGFPYQCVELARRYLVINHRVTFESIPMAYDIFDLKSVRVSDQFPK